MENATVGLTVGAVYDRPLFPAIQKKRAVIDRPYRKDTPFASHDLIEFQKRLETSEFA
jgi:hypothetical protein